MSDRARTNWGSGRLGGGGEKKDRPKLSLSLAEFSESFRDKTKQPDTKENKKKELPRRPASPKSVDKKKKRDRSPSLPPETDAEAEGKCMFHNIKLVDDTCTACLKDGAVSQKSQETALDYNTQREKKKPSPPKKSKPAERAKTPEELEEELFDEVGHSQMDSDSPRSMFSLKEKAKPKAPEPKKEDRRLHGGGKGLGPKPVDTALWQKHLKDLPDTVQIICDERDHNEPMVVFTIPKTKITVAQLESLESLRVDSVVSRPLAERNISKLLFGFKDITERLQAIESDFVCDDGCKDVGEAMRKFQTPGEWFDEHNCRAINPSVAPLRLDADDIVVPTTLRTYRLRTFWEHFTEMAEPYLINDNWDELAVVF